MCSSIGVGAIRLGSNRDTQGSAPPRSSRSNLRNPDLFDSSDTAKLQTFLTQCYLHFAERRQDFPTDDDKIYYMMSCLQGTAQQWFKPNLYDTYGVLPAWDGNFPSFIQELIEPELQDNFGPHDPVGDAEDLIRMVRMKHSDHLAIYIVEFD
ncbi:hypothetical protein B0H17DRAFT_926695 [Mycena rosella]|uniref:DUF4939 domain-containing protein n=1 Tax=Mycena rosella TaxID=1033263 RepID=A0AAD7GKU6_MYCRO|nr:hypothetical protein B0H17DRAFT_926695 [Mycena rosella]